ncbi:hypothetical protein MPDQ_005705 [Monascus purpureus]|uniref:Uncharacterized protein n=1 Tax=Monascus purpureus TaxID=5098 RepID=A0A507QI09_MONPU|nr:hypothetical protein MPDQ_005705 [Monascus purpureus]
MECRHVSPPGILYSTGESMTHAPTKLKDLQGTSQEDKIDTIHVPIPLPGRENILRSWQYIQLKVKIEFYDSHKQRKSDLRAVITGRLSDFACDLAAMAETLKHERLQFTSDEYNYMEAASLDLAKIANKVADEVKSLGKRQRTAVVAERQKLLSQAESAKLELMTNQKLRTPNKMILWATAFAPSVWDLNVLQKSTFDFVIEFLEPGGSLHWPIQLYDILNTLAVEQPLCHSSDFRAFLTGMYQSAGKSKNITGSCVQEEQTQQPEGAQEVIERAFLVPHSKLDKLLRLHSRSTACHSIILTIPITDRVATVVVSIPHDDAIRFGYESSLPVIFNSNFSSISA